jgi:hypothetical protein
MPMAIPASSIGEVLDELDLIINTTVKENNFLGIFAYVYRRTTAQVKQAILEKRFEDNARMEKMDVAFANLYLTAYQYYDHNMSCSASWQTAFEAKYDKITIMQHLMLGMNAHINMDLGVAAASLSTPESLPALKNDFMKINLILKDLVNEMQARVSRVSRLMFVLDWLGKNTDEKIVNFSMVKAREQSWKLACLLVNLKDAKKNSVMKLSDNTISVLGEIIRKPPGIFMKRVLWLVAYFEEKEVKNIIAGLQENQV